MRNLPRELRKTVAVYHLPTSGTQTYPSAADETIEGGLLPLDRHAHGLEGGEYVDPYELYLDKNADIRVTDKVVIDSDTFYVKKVFSGTFGGLAHKRATVSKDS